MWGPGTPVRAGGLEGCARTLPEERKHHRPAGQGARVPQRFPEAGVHISLLEAEHGFPESKSLLPGGPCPAVRVPRGGL